MNSSKSTSKKTISQKATSASAPSCDTSLVHLDNVRLVKSEVLATEQAQQMAEFFSRSLKPDK